MPRTSRAATIPSMHLTAAQSLTWISTAGAAWLMVRAGTAKRLLSVKTARRCASCGRRRNGHKPCSCSG
jgi:hypothetical protein